MLVGSLDACVDVVVGPEAVVEGFDLFDLPRYVGLRGQFGAGFREGLSVCVEVGVGEALVGEVLERVLFLSRSMLADDVLVCCDALAILAVKDVRFAWLEAWSGSAGEWDRNGSTYP